MKNKRFSEEKIIAVLKEGEIGIPVAEICRKYGIGESTYFRTVVLKKEKGTKTKAGKREVLLLPPALKALEHQKKYTFTKSKRVFYNSKKRKAWETDIQMRSAWQKTLKLSGMRYRNLYQTRHTYASQMLSAGENLLWVARQMGHKNTEMVIKHYGKWIPDKSTLTGYTPIHHWQLSMG